MARVIRVIGTPDGGRTDVTALPATGLKVKAGAASSIKKGNLVIKDGSNAGYVCVAADATDTDSVIVGVALADSTETASVDGYVDVFYAPEIYVEIFAKTPGSLVATMLYSKFILDVTSGSHTLDQGTTTKGFITLIDYNNTTEGKCIAKIACSL